MNKAMIMGVAGRAVYMALGAVIMLLVISKMA